MTFKQRLLSAFTAFALAASLLPTTALAANVTEGQNTNGGVGSGEYNTPYIIHSPGIEANAKNLSWKVDAYVSTSPTGKIDPKTDKIDSEKLKWVGGVLYDNFRHNNGKYTVYVQADHTADKRFNLAAGKAMGWSNGFPSGVESYYLPHLVQVKYTDKIYTLAASSGNRIIGHRTDNPFSLPKNAYDLEHCNYQTDVKAKFEDEEVVTKILNHINLSLGGSDNSADEIYKKILPILGEQVQSKLKAAREELIAQGKNGDEAIKRLLPNSVDPTTKQPNAIVQWCLIVTPMYNFADASSNGVTFWEGIDAESNEFTLYGLKSDYNWIGLDSYGIAQYNQTSKTMYKDQIYRNYLNSFKGGLLPAGAKFVAYNGIYDAAAFNSWSNVGKLRADIGSVTKDVANAMYDTHEENSYCGIPTHKAENEVGINTLNNNPGTYATYGIAAYLSKFTDPGIPVYYYTYDPDKPGEGAKLTTTTSYTPKDGTTTFTPTKDTGLPEGCTVVAMDFFTKIHPSK